MQRATLSGPLFTIVGIADLGSGAWVGLILLVALATGAIVRIEKHGARFARREGRVSPGT